MHCSSYSYLNASAYGMKCVYALISVDVIEFKKNNTANVMHFGDIEMTTVCSYFFSVEHFLSLSPHHLHSS